MISNVGYAATTETCSGIPVIDSAIFIKQIMDSPIRYSTKLPLVAMSTVHNTDLIEAPEFYENTGSGRATWDERGNTVWEWQTAPGIYSREVSAQQLQALQAAELHLIDQLPGVTLTHNHWRRRYQNPFHSGIEPRM